MPARGPWLKSEDSDFWHFCPICPFYPHTDGVELSEERPTKGAMCLTCRRLADENECE
jgi:hypothetical protein